MAFRAPIALYRAHLGFLLGHRFLMLEHVGRRSGIRRSTVLEVVTETDEAVYVAAGWGSKADWLRNVRADPNVVVHLGSRRFASRASIVDMDEAGAVLAAYADRHPKAMGKLAAFMLDDPGTTTREQVERLATTIPIVELPTSRPAGTA